MTRTSIWIDPEDHAVVLTRDYGDNLADVVELRTFPKADAAYRFAVDLETFLRAHGVDVELEVQ